MATKSKKSSSSSATPTAPPPRDLPTLMKSKFYVVPSFDIYGGKAGLVDLGPVMAGFEQNVLQEWRKHFIRQERMLEMSCTNVTPYRVLKSSGHVDRFTDTMVLDPIAGEAYRADHLIEDCMTKLLETEKDMTKERQEEIESIKIHAETFSLEESAEVIKKFNILSPAGNKLDPPHKFNLMFETKIGPTGKDPAFLRPEIAQGMFMNYRFCYEYTNGRLPFAGAQVGRAFRNEISPKGGLFRLREFSLAEIEHFYDPNEQAHPRFESTKDVVVYLLPRERQEANEEKTIRTTVGEAHLGYRGPIVSSEASSSSTEPTVIIANQTLAYFLGRTQLFLESVGLKADKIRFRQHLMKQMAHYARDCWDAEVLTSGEGSGGKPAWVEVVGIADRSCFDLSVHEKATGRSMTAQRKLEQPKKYEVVIPNKQLIGKSYKAKGKGIIECMERMEDGTVKALKKAIESGENFPIKPFSGKDAEEEVQITKEMVTGFKEETAHVETFTPYVIEPSFGISRIIFAIIDQNFHVREADNQRGVVAFPPHVAPYQLVVLPLQGDDALKAEAAKIEESLPFTIYNETSTVSIGKRYVRADEVGVAYAVTIDYETLDKGTVTIRERDSMEQVRVCKSELCAILKSLLSCERKWADLAKEKGLVVNAEKEE